MPDGSQLETYCGGGMDNPVEVAFTEAGEALGTMTFYNPDAARHDALVHFVYGGVYPKKHHCLSEFKRTGDLLPAISRFGVVAPSGLTRYRGVQFGEGYQDNFFSAQFNTHKIVRHVIERDGATFRSVDSDFLVSTSPDFHPTDVLEDADGSLLVVDTGGWFRIGCPTSQVAKPEILGGIYRVRRLGAPKVADPRGLKLDWSYDNPAKELAKRLNDPRPAVRDQAVAMLGDYGPEGITPLRLILSQNVAPLARRNAVWALARIAGYAAPKTSGAFEGLRDALNDRAPTVRQAAANSLGTVRDIPALDALGKMVVTDKLPNRRDAATALGRLGQAAAVGPLLESLRAGGDRFVEHATIYALIEINNRSATLVGLKDPAPSVRRGALIALDQMNDGGLTRELVAPMLDTDDQALQQTALEIIGRRKGWSDETLGLLRKWLSAAEPLGGRTAAARGALLAFRDDPNIQALVAETLANKQVPQATRQLMLEVIARSELKTLPETWREQLAAALRCDDASTVRQAVAAVAAIGDRRFDGRLLEIGRLETAPDELRVAAVSAVARRGAALDDALFQLLQRRLGPETQPLERLAAAEGLGSAALDDAQAGELVGLIDRAGPLELAPLLQAFVKPRPQAVARRLVAALEKSPGLTSLTPETLQRVFKAYPPETADLAKPLFAKLRVDVAEQRQRLAGLAPSVMGGDPERGRQVFLGKRTGCTACHRVQGLGETIGPDLSKIGEARTSRDLLEAILYPSASFARGYESYTVVTDQGLSATGVISRETADAVYLRTAQRAEVRVPRGQLEQMAPSRVSVMPQGLEKTITRTELRDLIAFLQSLK